LAGFVVSEALVALTGRDAPQALSVHHPSAFRTREGHAKGAPAGSAAEVHGVSSCSGGLERALAMA